MTNGSTSRVEEISAVLQSEILRGQYRPGERLPSERELAARFEANRGAVRESLKKLQQLGIADITPGGVRVIPVEQASLSVLGPLLDLHQIPDASLVGHLFEVLGALIAMSARTAVQRADPAQLEQLDGIISLMVADTTGENNQANWDKLGTLFSEINGNLVLRLILNGLKTHFLDRLSNRVTGLSIDWEKRHEILLTLKSGIASRNARCVAEGFTEYFLLINQGIQNALATAQTTTAPIQSRNFQP